VADTLRERILRGILPPGTRLSSSRRLAGDLGVSRTTILTAYESLKAEGYLTSRTGSGHFVAEDLPLPPTAPTAKAPTVRSDQTDGAAHRLSQWGMRAVGHRSQRILAGRAGQSEPIQYDFLFGLSLTDVFPHAAWKRAVSKRGLTATVIPC
jgi:GntR family transcriptional regulator/MocR family aminotransferase